MKELSSRVLGIKGRLAEVIKEQKDNIVWSKGILGTDNPQKLLDTLIYPLGSDEGGGVVPLQNFSLN